MYRAAIPPPEWELEMIHLELIVDTSCAAEGEFAWEVLVYTEIAPEARHAHRRTVTAANGQLYAVTVHDAGLADTEADALRDGKRALDTYGVER